MKTPLQTELDRYQWYHKLTFRGGEKTNCYSDEGIQQTWDWMRDEMAETTFLDRRVLDVGARDCLFSYEAIKLGADFVQAIDSDVNPGVNEVVAPQYGLLASNFSYTSGNAYLLGDFQEQFDVTMFFGVLYHLRYPHNGLSNALRTVKVGGTFLLETAMYFPGTDLLDTPLIYYPTDDSPYEKSSCSFFSQSALINFCKDEGFIALSLSVYPKNNKGPIRRTFMRFYRQTRGLVDSNPRLNAYWNMPKHDCHTNYVA